MIVRDHQPRHLRWPADRFYWAVLDGAAVGGSASTARGRRRLGYLFENVLPGVSIDDVHAVYQRVPGDRDRYLACGVMHGDLDAVDTSDVVTLTPAATPSFVAERVRPETINLLSGRHAPRQVRRLGAVWIASIAVLLAAAASLVIVRLERTSDTARAELAALDASKEAVFEQVLGADAVSGVLPPEQLLVAERRRLEQTRTAEVGGAELVDCSLVLGRLLGRWPQELEVRTESISVSPDAITIRALVPSTQSAQSLANALGGLEGWQMDQPQTQARQEEVDVTLRFTRADAGGDG